MSACTACDWLDAGDTLDGETCDVCGATYDVRVGADGVPRATRRLVPGRPLTVTRTTLAAIRGHVRKERLS